MARMKSPNYPAIGLSQAIESARLLWDKEKRTPVTPDVAVKAMGYTSLNGATLTRLSALKKYGLLEADGKRVRISQLAMRILHTQDGSEDRQRAIDEAGFKPELFRELSASHADASDAALRSHLVVERGFSEAGAKNFIAAFRDTLALAKRANGEYSSDKSSEERGTMADTAVARVVGDPVRITDSVRTQHTRVFTWPLPNDTTAELRLTGGTITQAHLEMLRQYLELAKAAVPKASEGD